MKFNHVPPKELLELNTETINGKRFYITPDGNYPSITSVLSSFPNPALSKWRSRVGETEANRISSVASSRGTKFHLLCEKYLSNEEIVKNDFMPDALGAFHEFKSILHRIDNIHKLEVPLYSKKLKVAGRCDSIAEFDGELSIIDFKTSKKEKREDWIQDYFIQATFYSMAYFELSGILAKQIAILISVDDGDDQIFVKPVRDYVKLTVEKINQYYRLYHV